MNILITRPLLDSEDLMGKLFSLGHKIIHVPTLKISPMQINPINPEKYNAFIFTYHDQALIPFKILSNYEGVNFTSNLDIIRVSPSHGTAENLIGSNKAISDGIINCFDLIKKIHKNRK